MKSPKKKVLFDLYSPARRAHSARILASMRHHRSPRTLNAANILVSLRKSLGRRRSRSPTKKRKSRSPKRKSSKRANSLRLQAQIMKSRM